MNWQQIREHYPNQWVIMEALQAHTEGRQRIFEELGILDSCEDNSEVFPRYRKIRAQFSQKEIIFFHSSRADLDIEVRHRISPRWPHQTHESQNLYESLNVSST